MRKSRGLVGEAVMVFIGAIAISFGFLLFYGKGWPPSPREWGILIAGPIGTGCMSTVLFLYPARVRQAAEVVRFGWKGEQSNDAGVGYVNPDLMPRSQPTAENAARRAEEARLEQERLLRIAEIEAELATLRSSGSAASDNGGVVA